MAGALQPSRVFKTAWFTKAAQKARITDEDLCEAIGEVMRGQADDLGGGVYKKRLDRNRHRSIILAKGQHYWIYQYLFAKRVRANIRTDELGDFRTLAKAYAGLDGRQVAQLKTDNALMEICDDEQDQVQERSLRSDP